MKTRSLLLLATVTIFLLHATAAEKVSRKGPLGKPIDLPHAGLRISLPARQHLAVPSRGVLLWGKDGVLSETIVRAIPAKIVGPSVTTKAFAEKMAAIFQKTSGFEKSAPVFSGPVKVAARRGWRIARKFSFRDRAQIVVITVWTSEITKQKKTLYYVIGSILKGKDAKKALAMHNMVCRSVKRIPVRSPSEMDLPPLLKPVELKTELFDIGVPRGWFLRSLGRQPGPNNVIDAAVVDYLRNILVPNMSVTVVSTGLGLRDGNAWSNKKECEEYIAVLRKQWATDPNRSYVSHRMAKMGGKNGIEYVCRVNMAHWKAVQVQRQVFHKGNIYTVTVTWDGNKNIKRAVAAMNKFADSVKFFDRPRPTTTKPATRPATRPTTRPAGPF